MSDSTPVEVDDWATSRDTFEHTFEVDGKEVTLEIKDITDDELERYEDREESGEDERELVTEALNEYVANLEADAGELPPRKRNLLFVQLMRAWSGADGMMDAMEEVQPPGNRR